MYRRRRKINYRRRPRKVRRGYGKKNKQKLAIYKAPHMGVGFPSQTYAKLKYVKQFSSATGSSPFVLWFRGNGMNDPEYAIGGHSPMYFDQYMAVYNKFMVYASSIKLSIMNSNSSAALQCALYPGDSAGTLLGSLSEVLEQTRASAAVTIPLSQQRASVIKRFAKTSNVLGLNRNQLGDDDLTGTASSSPAKQWFWTMYLESVDSVTPVSGSILIEIKYYVKFQDRKLETQSGL